MLTKDANNAITGVLVRMALHGVGGKFFLSASK